MPIRPRLQDALADLSGDEPGLTGAAARTALLAGRAGNRLRSIRGPFSVDRDQFTLNETELHESFAGHFGEDAGPWLVLGHTHVPGDGPWDPGTNSRYERYVNSGSGVAERVITAVEWDGAATLRARRAFRPHTRHSRTLRLRYISALRVVIVTATSNRILSTAQIIKTPAMQAVVIYCTSVISARSHENRIG